MAHTVSRRVERDGAAVETGSDETTNRRQYRRRRPRSTARSGTIAALTGGRGQPLPESHRPTFEGQFDTGLDHVRVHTGGRADGVARSVNAVALTHGSDVVFRSGAYRPETADGRRLLAHELTHVVQQGGMDPNVPAIQRVPMSTPAGDPYTQGVMHDHQPQGQWSQIQEQSQNPVCAFGSPEQVYWTAVNTILAQYPLAREYANNYRSGGGDQEVDVGGFVRNDPGVRGRPGTEVERSDRGHFKVEQGLYGNQGYRFAFGAIDRLDYRVERAPLVREDVGVVHVWFADRYEWHPVYSGIYTKKPGDDARTLSNCVHAAAVELKTEGAADFWMYGYETLVLAELDVAPAESPSDDDTDVL